MATVSSGTTSERFGFIEVHGQTLGVGYLCKWLGVSPSGFYTWCNREPSKREIADRELLKEIIRIHKQSGGAYGSPRVFHALKREGFRIGRKRVERLMREAGIVGKVALQYRRVPAIEKFYQRFGNLCIDAPQPTRVNQRWVADLTYIKVNYEWRYLAVVLDVYSRKVIGWSLGQYKTAELTLRALKQALKVRQPEKGLIFHTDRGVEYGARLIQNELNRYGIRPSMNRPGKCTDNAFAETFFHTLKAEKLHGVTFKSETELRMALNVYINRFYNNKRLHSGIGYSTPVEYEKMAA